MFFGTNVALTFITVLPLFLIVGTIILKGVGQINWSFFTEPSPTAVDAMMAKMQADRVVGERVVLPGGIANGIVGTLLMVVIASLIAIPLGVLGGI